MARVTPGPLIGTITGTVGSAVTFARRGGGLTVYPYIHKRDARSPAQLVQRQRYREAVDAWNALPDAEKADWNARAAGYSGQNSPVKVSA